MRRPAHSSCWLNIKFGLKINLSCSLLKAVLIRSNTLWLGWKWATTNTYIYHLLISLYIYTSVALQSKNIETNTYRLKARSTATFLPLSRIPYLWVFWSKRRRRRHKTHSKYTLIYCWACFCPWCFAMAFVHESFSLRSRDEDREAVRWFNPLLSSWLFKNAENTAHVYSNPS